MHPPSPCAGRSGASRQNAGLIGPRITWPLKRLVALSSRLVIVVNIGTRARAAVLHGRGLGAGQETEDPDLADLSGAGPGGPGDQVASRGGDCGPVVGEDRGRGGQDGRVLDAEPGGDEGGKFVVGDIGRAGERLAGVGSAMIAEALITPPVRA